MPKKLFVFKGDGAVEESFQPYTEYLEIEKELSELNSFEFEKTKSNNTTKESSSQKDKKQTKLSYKDQRGV